MTPFFSSLFSTVCNIDFWIWKCSKFIFMWSPVWSILVCKIPQFLAKCYRFGRLIILFWKVDTLRLLKLFTMFCPHARTKYPFFWYCGYLWMDVCSWILYLHLIFCLFIFRQNSDHMHMKYANGLQQQASIKLSSIHVMSFRSILIL